MRTQLERIQAEKNQLHEALNAAQGELAERSQALEAAQAELEQTMRDKWAAVEVGCLY